MRDKIKILSDCTYITMYWETKKEFLENSCTFKD